MLDGSDSPSSTLVCELVEEVGSHMCRVRGSPAARSNHLIALLARVIYVHLLKLSLVKWGVIFIRAQMIGVVNAMCRISLEICART